MIVGLLGIAGILAGRLHLGVHGFRLVVLAQGVWTLWTAWCVLIAALQFIEYRWIVVEHSIEVYGALIAALFAVLGLWLGDRLTRRSAAVPVPEIVIREILVPAPQTLERDERQLAALGLTPRESHSR